jgi:hypothetical protein
MHANIHEILQDQRELRGVLHGTVHQDLEFVRAPLKIARRTALVQSTSGVPWSTTSLDSPGTHAGGGNTDQIRTRRATSPPGRNLQLFEQGPCLLRNLDVCHGLGGGDKHAEMCVSRGACVAIEQFGRSMRQD